MNRSKIAYFISLRIKLMERFIIKFVIHLNKKVNEVFTYKENKFTLKLNKHFFHWVGLNH